MIFIFQFMAIFDHFLHKNIVKIGLKIQSSYLERNQLCRKYVFMAKNINYFKKMSFKTKKYKHFQAIFEFVTVFT